MRGFLRFMAYATLAACIIIGVMCIAVGVACEIIIRHDQRQIIAHRFNQFANQIQQARWQ